MNEHESKHDIKEFEGNFERYMNSISALFINSGK